MDWILRGRARAGEATGTRIYDDERALSGGRFNYVDDGLLSDITYDCQARGTSCPLGPLGKRLVGVSVYRRDCST